MDKSEKYKKIMDAIKESIRVKKVAVDGMVAGRSIVLYTNLVS